MFDYRAILANRDQLIILNTVKYFSILTVFLCSFQIAHAEWSCHALLERVEVAGGYLHSLPRRPSQKIQTLDFFNSSVRDLIESQSYKSLNNTGHNLPDVQYGLKGLGSFLSSWIVSGTGFRYSTSNSSGFGLKPHILYSGSYNSPLLVAVWKADAFNLGGFRVSRTENVLPQTGYHILGIFDFTKLVNTKVQVNRPMLSNQVQVTLSGDIYYHANNGGGLHSVQTLKLIFEHHPKSNLVKLQEIHFSSRRGWLFGIRDPFQSTYFHGKLDPDIKETHFYRAADKLWSLERYPDLEFEKIVLLD